MGGRYLHIGTSVCQCDGKARPAKLQGANFDGACVELQSAIEQLQNGQRERRLAPALLMGRMPFATRLMPAIEILIEVDAVDRKCAVHRWYLSPKISGNIAGHRHAIERQ